LLAGIFFVLWLQNAGSLAFATRIDRAIRRASDGPARWRHCDLQRHPHRRGDAHFLDETRPNAVIARLSIQSGAPISQDTQADLDTQGIVGDVQSRSMAARPLSGCNGAARTRRCSARGRSRSLSQEARAALSELRSVFSDNAEPLRDVIANVDAFSAALARNSGRVDTILAGLERMTGGKQETPRIFDLAVPSLPACPRANRYKCRSPSRRRLVMYDTQKLLVADGKGEISPASLQWSDTIPKLVASASWRRRSTRPACTM